MFSVREKLLTFWNERDGNMSEKLSKALSVTQLRKFETGKFKKNPLSQLKEFSFYEFYLQNFSLNAIRDFSEDLKLECGV